MLKLKKWVKKAQWDAKILGKSFSKSLIIKILGKSADFKFLEKKVIELWACKSHFEIVDLADDYYVVKFSNDDDYSFILYEGP